MLTVLRARQVQAVRAHGARRQAQQAPQAHAGMRAAQAAPATGVEQLEDAEGAE